MTECIMLDNVTNGDLIIAGSYKFIWNGHMIHNNDIFNYYDCECEVSDVTKVIRISKILDFLKQQTGLKFNYYRGVIRNNNFTVYDVKDKRCCLIENKIMIKDKYITWSMPMEPSEFIEKIAKGEWV